MTRFVTLPTVSRRSSLVMLLSLASCCPLAVPAPASAQLTFEESASAFQRDGIEPAATALAAKDVAGARRRLTDVTRGFQALPQGLRIGQATNVRRLALGYMAIRLYDEAATLLELSVEALEAAVPAANPSLALALADLARARRLAGRLDDAEALLIRARTLRGTTAAADPDAFPIQVELAELRRDRGDVAGADDLLRPLIAAADRMQGWEYVPNLVPLFEAYAAILSQRGQSELARTFISRAETIRKHSADAEDQMRQFQRRP